ncbi:MAG: FAD:protein FMN transferase, partial [bacterium]
MNFKRLGTIITLIVVIALIAIAFWHSSVKNEGLVTKKFTTMGTYLTITAHPKNKRSKEAISKAYREARRLNDKYSTHSKDSLISKIKRRAPDSVPVDDEFVFLFREATKFRKKTGGNFDVTVGPL